MARQQFMDGIDLPGAEIDQRFVAFAFASADMMAEVDHEGIIVYAAGAFRARLGAAPELWVGRPLAAMVAPADREALELSLTMLRERGRLLPLTMRLSDRPRTRMVLAGLRLGATGPAVRLCLTWAQPAAPLGAVRQAVTTHRLARAVETRLRGGEAFIIGLMEVIGAPASLVEPAMENLVPHALVDHIGLGRYGLLATGLGPVDMLDVATAVEAGLRARGVAATVRLRSIVPDAGGLTVTQAARATRQALETFAGSGVAGLDGGGFSKGLAAYLENAMRHFAVVRDAIAGRSFGMMFQPVVRLADRRLHYYEALIRPRPLAGCPAGTPQEFVTLAETVGLAPELDLAVAASVCAAAQRAPVAIAMNVSGQSMELPPFRDRLLAKLTRSAACKEGRLMVEMTETSMLADLPEAARTALAIRQNGVRFCLDDFGAGAADLRVLRAMPADFVKIEGSFVAGIVTDERERGLVAGMVELAHAAGAAVVAERVETEAEADTLLALGADFAQGWLFGRPSTLPGVHDTPARPYARRRH